MRRILLYNIEIPLDSGDKALYRTVLRRLGVDRSRIESIELSQRALDARIGRFRTIHPPAYV